jgi:hypothetical protein
VLGHAAWANSGVQIKKSLDMNAEAFFMVGH